MITEWMLSSSNDAVVQALEGTNLKSLEKSCEDSVITSSCAKDVPSDGVHFSRNEYGVGAHARNKGSAVDALSDGRRERWCKKVNGKNP